MNRAGGAGGRKRSIEVPIETVGPSPFRVRMVLDMAAIRQLDAEAKNTQAIEPVVVWERFEEPGRYVVLEGERRRRVALRAGLKTLPVRVRVVRDERDAEAQTLVAEVSRWGAASVGERWEAEPLVEGAAYARLLELGLSQKEIARALNREKSTISYRLRLTKLPERARVLIDAGVLNAKQGQELFRFPGRPEVFEGLLERAVTEGLSGREKVRVGEVAANVLGQGVVAEAEERGR